MLCLLRVNKKEKRKQFICWHTREKWRATISEALFEQCAEIIWEIIWRIKTSYSTGLKV